MFINLKNQDFKELNKIAIPLIIQNVACMLIGIVDEIFIGHISAEAYSAIGIAVSLMNFMAGVFSYFAVAFNILGAKKNGENEIDGFKSIFTTSIMIDIIVGILYGLLSIFCCKFVYSKIYGLSGLALSSAVKYTIITSPYMLIQMLIFTMNSYFKIKKNTSKLMTISIIATILNVVLDYVLIYGKFGFPRLDVAGAAIASIISILFNLIVLIYFARKDIVFSIHQLKEYFQTMGLLIRESIPLIGEELLEGSIFVIVINAIISNIGVIEIGGYLLVKNILDIALISMYMYGSAELTLVSEKCGAKKENEIHAVTYQGIFITFIIFILLAIVAIIFRNDIPKLITEDPELVSYASTIIIPMIIMNIFNPVQVIYKYVLQACEDAKFVLYVSAGINVIALALILVLYGMRFGILSIFIGLFVNYVLLTITYHIRLKYVINQKSYTCTCTN